MPILRIEIPDDLHQRIDAQKPEYLDRKGFVCLILDQALDRGSSISAYHVGAGGKGAITSAQPSFATTGSEGFTESTVHSSIPSTPVSHGEDVEERGSGGKPKKKGDTGLKPIPDNLQQHETLIREFWQCKKGSRNARAWSLLLTELDKIQTTFDDDRLKDQLMLAINGLWKGITMSNMQRFEPAKKPWQQEPEMKHPAHRDFTAERIAAERAEREEEEKHNFFGF